MSSVAERNMRIATAVHQGVKDFQAGSHLNPYDHSDQPELFRAWIEGYRTAKDISENIDQETEQQ